MTDTNIKNEDESATQSTNLLPQSMDESEVWEDLIPPELVEPPSTTARSEASSPSGSLRKRKPGRLVYVATSPRKKQFVTYSPKPPKPPPNLKPPVVVPKDVTRDLLAAVVFTAGYCLDVIRWAIILLKRPLAFMLFLWILALIVVRLWHVMSAALSPLCYLPFVSSMVVCQHIFLGGNGTKFPQWADYPRLIDVQSATFEQLMDHSLGGLALPLNIKKAEMATADLMTLIRYSDLKTRDLIANSLAEFVNDAKKAGRGLQKLNAKANGAVDTIMAVNEFALRSIEEAQSNRPGIARRVFWPTAAQSTDDAVVKTFNHAMDVLSNSMHRLIIEAEISIANLDKLEEDLSVLHELVTLEDSSLSAAKSELLSLLWTQLGGNQRELRNFNGNLRLLKDLGEYRRQALVHVVAALQTLHAMSEDMEDLRERVSAPELAGGRIPVEVHLNSIRAGMERMKQGRISAKVREEDAMRRVLERTPEY